MLTIYKYPVDTKDKFILELPKRAEILTVQTQMAHPVLWAIVETENAIEKRVFEVYGTGDQLRRLDENSNRKYIGTYQLMSGMLVFHLFEIELPF